MNSILVSIALSVIVLTVDGARNKREVTKNQNFEKSIALMLTNIGNYSEFQHLNFNY